MEDIGFHHIVERLFIPQPMCHGKAPLCQQRKEGFFWDEAWQATHVQPAAGHSRSLISSNLGICAAASNSGYA
jgi:hypothetical protein